MKNTQLVIDKLVNVLIGAASIIAMLYVANQSMLHEVLLREAIIQLAQHNVLPYQEHKEPPQYEIEAPTSTLTIMRFQLGSTTYSINGLSHTIDIAPWVDDYNRMMILLYDIANLFGAKVIWLEETGTVRIYRPTSKEYILLSGGLINYVNIDNRIFVPIRYISKFLGAKDIMWDESNHAVYIVVYLDIMSS